MGVDRTLTLLLRDTDLAGGDPGSRSSENKAAMRSSSLSSTTTAVLDRLEPVDGLTAVELLVAAAGAAADEDEDEEEEEEEEENATIVDNDSPRECHIEEGSTVALVTASATVVVEGCGMPRSAMRVLARMGAGTTADDIFAASAI
jgi:hypothetical protein